MTADIRSRSQLAVALSKLKGFSNPKVRLEQYQTDSEVAATVLWYAYMQGDIQGKTVADLGCGTGILGIGALMLGASKVFLVEKDPDALEILKKNLDFVVDRSRVVFGDVSGFNIKVDTVVQNPPFGVKTRHADKPFLEKALQIAKVIYSFHNEGSDNFVSLVCQDYDAKIAGRMDFTFPIKASMAFHSKPVEKIAVSCYHIIVPHSHLGMKWE